MKLFKIIYSIFTVISVLISSIFIGIIFVIDGFPKLIGFKKQGLISYLFIGIVGIIGAPFFLLTLLLASKDPN